MRIKDILKKRKSGVSFEFFPPKSVAGKDKFMNVVHDLEKHDPLYVSVTCGAVGPFLKGLSDGEFLPLPCGKIPPSAYYLNRGFL